MAEKNVHLRDLFNTGRMAEIAIVEGDDPDQYRTIQIWLRKPAVTQYEEAASKARGRQARRRALYRNPESDEYLSIQEHLDRLETKEELVEELVAFQMNDLRSKAYNQALYGDADEEEPRWGKDGKDYLDMLAGLRERYEEIERYNDDLAPGDENLRITPDSDDEIVRLNAILEEFGAQRDELLNGYLELEKRKLSQKTVENIRKELAKKLIDLECSMSYYQEYRQLMLYFAARYPDDHSKQYFKSPDEIWEYPEYVRTRLFSEYDAMELGADSLKNSLSPQPS